MRDRNKVVVFMEEYTGSAELSYRSPTCRPTFSISKKRETGIVFGVGLRREHSAQAVEKPPPGIAGGPHP